MSKEYTYSMPQKFMDDPNVALKWKLYGYLNGFWLAGKPVYARNDTIAKQFGKAERSVQEALAELEKMGLITRDIKGLSRYILPGGLKEEARGPASPQDEAQARGGTRPSLTIVHIDNADTNNGELEDELRVVPANEEDKPTKKEKDVQAERAVKYWYGKCKDEIGQTPSGGNPKHLKVIKEARKTLSYPQIKQMMDEWFENESQEPHEMIQITRCLSSFRIDKFLAENV